MVAAVILAVVLGNREETPVAPNGTGGPSTAASAKLPKGVKDATAPIVASNGGVMKEGVPTLQVFEDFQCPVCKQAEERFGAKIADLAAQGKINLVYYTKTFMDDNLRNDSSTKVGNASLCAADAGKFKAYHDKVFAKQPTEEGKGYSDDDVQVAATEAGLSGAAMNTWKQCVADKTYVPYLQGIERFTSETMKVTGTPAFYVDGKKMDLAGVDAGDAFEKKLFETAR